MPNNFIKFGIDLLPNADGVYNLGKVDSNNSNNNLRWNIYGTLTGNADTATTASKLTTSNLGSTTKPIYLVAGVATECNDYAGGTAITLNGTSKAHDTASFYAPTDSGTSSYILKSNGSNSAPTWIQILPVANGGTGVSSFTDGQVVYPATTSGVQSLTGNSNFTYTTSSHILTLGKLTITGGSTNSSLSTTGTLTISSGSKKTTTIESGSTIYITTKSQSSILFSINNAEVGRFNTSGHFVPFIAEGESVSTYQLGLSSQRWAKLFVGTSSSYGDAYTPIYWNNGVPASVQTIQQANFTITNSGANAGTATISTNTSANSMVTEIVVIEDDSNNSYISNLQAPITWSISGTSIVLSTTVSGRIDGYILYTK